MDQQLLSIILQISKQLVEVGAEIHRVEESVVRICQAYGARQIDVYATTFNIIVSIENEDGSSLTHSRRIRRTGTNLEKLDRLNALVRNITENTPDVKEIQKHLEDVQNCPTYPVAVVILAYGIIAGAFCVFFGGQNVYELLAAFCSGLLVGAVAHLMTFLSFNKLLKRFLCSFVACTCAFLCVKAGWVARADYIIIGNIMSLIPGIGLTNSLRDLFTGDSITGILRSIEAILLALSIACGYILSALMFGGVL